MTSEKREFLKHILCSREDVDAWIAGRAFPFSKYDSELGYLHRDREFQDGIEGSITTYRYDSSGSRRMINYADQECRINTYGNSFTHCDQVSDGETWQEILAAHLCEPVRNFGVGGYSVYQAYLRLQREESRSPAKYIIFNIYDDDHYRNLLSWQRFRFRVTAYSFNSTVPYVKVNPERGEFIECENLCSTPESLYNLCDLDSVFEIFKDDFVFNRKVAQQSQKERKRKGELQLSTYDDLMDTLYTESSLYASMQIVDNVEEYARDNNKKVLYVLSYRFQNIENILAGGSRFDLKFVEYLKNKNLSVVDLMNAHKEDYAEFKGSIEAYIKKYYDIDLFNHYTPLGNFFCAFAIKDSLVSMLEPKPLSYSKL